MNDRGEPIYFGGGLPLMEQGARITLGLTSHDGTDKASIVLLANHNREDRVTMVYGDNRLTVRPQALDLPGEPLRYGFILGGDLVISDTEGRASQGVRLLPGHIVTQAVVELGGEKVAYLATHFEEVDPAITRRFYPNL